MAAVSSDDVVIELQARTAAHDAALLKSADIYEQSMARIKRAAEGTESADEARTRSNIARRLRIGAAVRGEADTVVTQSARAANATRNLGRQVSDIGVGLAGGQSPFLILAQQAPQVADALADTGGKAAKLALFFAGPWGAALLAAGSIVGVLGSKLLESGNEAESATPKLARYTDVLARLAGIDLGDLNLTNERRKLQDLIDQAPLKEQTGNRGGANARAAERAAARERIADIGRELALNKQADARADAAEKQKDAAREAESKAKQAATKAQNDAKQAAEALKKTVDDLVKAYDPDKSMTDYLKVLKDINEVEAKGLITAERAKQFRDGASLGRQLQLRTEDIASDSRRTGAINDILSRPGGISDQVAQSDRDIASNQKGAEDDEKRKLEVERKVYQERERNIRTLAGLYRSAFEGGAKGIGQALKNALLDAIATALARRTVGSFASALGSLGSESGFFGQIASALTAGRASGGPVMAGQLYRVNERGTEGFRPAQSGTIVPLGRMKGGGGSTTVIQQSFTLDARGGITTPELLNYVNQTARDEAAKAGRVSYNASVAAVPGRMSQFQRDGR